MKTAIVWFRNDLRVSDHEPLLKASLAAEQVIPVYVLDPGIFQFLRWGFPKTGKRKIHFLLESLAVLKVDLQRLGSNLKFILGDPAEELIRLAVQQQAEAIFSSKELASEEVSIEQKLEKNLWHHHVELQLFQTNYLIHPEDIPYPIKQLPDVFTIFRKTLEKDWKVRQTTPSPEGLSSPKLADWGEIPDINSLTKIEAASCPTEKGVLDFSGGASAAWERLNQYFWTENRLRDYKVTRNGMLGQGYSSKFSAWLALGCISPLQIYHEVKRYENERIANESTYWLIFELLWRDYFRYVFKKYGNKFFKQEGITNQKPDSTWNESLFWKWANGETGNTFVDANMRELKQTGFMSNRGRQNVASYFVHDLKLDWVAGAAWFEHALIDYDVHSNWGNWAYVAGVGNDPRENRYFNTAKQAATYDPQGLYVKHWLDNKSEVNLSA